MFILPNTRMPKIPASSNLFPIADLFFVSGPLSEDEDRYLFTFDLGALHPDSTVDGDITPELYPVLFHSTVGGLPELVGVDTASLFTLLVSEGYESTTLLRGLKATLLSREEAEPYLAKMQAMQDAYYSATIEYVGDVMSEGNDWASVCANASTDPLDDITEIYRGGVIIDPSEVDADTLSMDLMIPTALNRNGLVGENYYLPAAELNQQDTAPLFTLLLLPPKELDAPIRVLKLSTAFSSHWDVLTTGLVLRAAIGKLDLNNSISE